MSNGTYVGVRVAQSSHDDIKNFCVSFNIPLLLNHFDRRLHTTLIYSTKCADIIVNEDLVHCANFKKFSMFTNSTTRKDTVLVMELDSPSLVRRHVELMQRYDLNYSHDNYSPHITLSYDFEGDVTKLPVFDREIFLYKEYTEELKL